MLPLVRQVAALPCGPECEACALANVQRPSVEYRPTKEHPEARWLHGTELRDWWARKEASDAARTAFFDGIKARINRMAGVRAQRGDEPR